MSETSQHLQSIPLEDPSSLAWLDALSVAVYLTDADGLLTHFNRAAVELSGREPEIGSDSWCVSWKLFRPDGTSMPHDQCPMAVALKEGRSLEGAELIVERPDGERIWCEAYPTPLLDEGGEVSGGINMLLDITERKRHEQGVRRSEEKLSDLIQNATVGVHHVGPDGTVLAANRAELNLLGYSRDEYVGRHIADFHADQEVIDDILRRLKAGESLHEYEARLQCKNGSIRHVLISSNVLWEDGEFVQTRCFTTDITDRKRAEVLLMEQKRLLEMIASGAPVDECLSSLCAAVSKLSPGTRASLLLTDDSRRRFLRSISPDLPSFGERLEDAPIDEGAAGTCGEAVQHATPVACLDIANDEKWPEPWRELCVANGILASHSAPILGVDGDPMGSFMVCLNEPRELTGWERRLSELGTHIGSIALERDRTIRKAEEARADAEEANRAKSHFLATMSHELRTPLNAIIGYTDLLDARIVGPLTPGQQEHLGRIDASARHLLQLIEEVLSYARIEAGREEVEIESADLAALVRSTAALVEPLAEDGGLTMEIAGPAEAPIRTDPKKVRQILLNLLSNAIKFTDEGTVRVEVLGTSDDAFLLRVSDTGVGIPPDQQDRIFDTFSQGEQTLHSRPNGTGLGLSVSRRLASLLGGDIDFESTLGEGSTFTVKLPRN